MRTNRTSSSANKKQTKIQRRFCCPYSTCACFSFSPSLAGPGTLLFGTWPRQQPGASSSARRPPPRNAANRGRDVLHPPDAGLAAVARPLLRESPTPPPPAPRTRTDKSCSRDLVPSAAVPTHSAPPPVGVHNISDGRQKRGGRVKTRDVRRESERGA